MNFINFRREQLLEALKDTSTVPLTMTVFPRIGCHNFTHPEHTLKTVDPVFQSLFIPNEAISGAHPKFRSANNLLTNLDIELSMLNLLDF